MDKPKVIVIVGPTASGKSALALELAKRINGEIISCDSMQIYKEMDIGTAKPTKKEQEQVQHYLVDFLSPSSRYNVSDFKKDAEVNIEKVLEKGKVPIVVGGTGLYVNALIYNINYLEEEYDASYREELENRADIEGLDSLYKEAMQIDKEATQKISKNDRKRILRILEIYKKTGRTKTEQDKLSIQDEPKYNYLMFGINIEREILYERINQRVDKMIEEGLIEEVENIYKKYNEFPTAMQAIGYKEVVSYLNDEISKGYMIEKIKMETRRYAKRQLTWFRKNKKIYWLNGLENMQNNIKIILEEYSGKKEQES
ncbi:MAG: tRNA (adenosine(37)-N6)-dimethylallyltransferase MiaA [Clostridia bacterium]|nr:tRNA (adenosine(37)-N6)-dimethylallyltransferase MiaA [Clostridia bacterium]